MEGAAALFNDCLLALDEISECDPREVGAIVYALGEGGRKLPQEKIREGMLAAAAIGYLCKHNATLSGAEGGCQAEAQAATCLRSAGPEATRRVPASPSASPGRSSTRSGLFMCLLKGGEARIPETAFPGGVSGPVRPTSVPRR